MYLRPDRFSQLPRPRNDGKKYIENRKINKMKLFNYQER